MTYWICQAGNHRVELNKEPRYRIEQEWRFDKRLDCTRFAHETCGKHLRLAVEQVLKGEKVAAL